MSRVSGDDLMIPAVAVTVGTVLAYVEFTDTITLGSVIIGSVVAIAGLFGISRGVKWRVAAEVSSSAADELRKALSDEKEISASRETRLVEEARAAREALTAAQATITRLESLPDLARVVALMDAHEVRAQERHESVVQVLKALTERIVYSQVEGARA
jgi:hypothetical protein